MALLTKIAATTAANAARALREIGQSAKADTRSSEAEIHRVTTIQVDVAHMKGG
jgi:hypothetical protein